MSLEAKIEKLTVAVEALTAQLALTQTQPKTKVPSEKAETTSAPKDEGPSVEDLQTLAMTIVRKDRTKKTPIKELIASYDGAKVIGEVPKDKLSELAEKMGAL